MNFMGIGPLELLLILIIGFLFFGPDELPEVAARAGRLFRNFKKVTSDLSKTISEELTTESKAERVGKTPPTSVSDGRVNEQ